MLGTFFNVRHRFQFGTPFSILKKPHLLFSFKRHRFYYKRHTFSHFSCWHIFDPSGLPYQGKLQSVSTTPARNQPHRSLSRSRYWIKSISIMPGQIGAGYSTLLITYCTVSRCNITERVLVLEERLSIRMLTIHWLYWLQLIPCMNRSE